MDGNNWRTAQAQGQVANGAVETSDWRARLQPGSRHRIVNKIMETLKKHRHLFGRQARHELRKIAVRFEEKVYTAAVSQSDYLRKISLKMLSVETKSQTLMANSLQSNNTTSAQNPQLPGTHNVMQNQVNSPGQPLSIPMVTNQSQTGQQLVSQNSVANTMGQGMVANSQTSQQILYQQQHLYNQMMKQILQQQHLHNQWVKQQLQQLILQQQYLYNQMMKQQQQQQSQTSQQILYHQHLYNQMMKQQLSLMQSHMQQHQHLLQQNQIQSSQQAVMQPSLQQNQQQPTQSVLTQQQTQQQQSVANIQHNNLLDMQHQQSRVIAQQTNCSNIQQQNNLGHCSQTSPDDQLNCHADDHELKFIIKTEVKLEV
ncbi:mediator of RNA polymerase II transcription subunit 15a-like [Ipomoea triloba]|uniref:mediator of RNA polymerase II transcription subunit 15a-like n=1 Tax=Ipomoea triloba TaxID=35885 RepID=UPI00125CFAD8|nr:mediator of RNA polymerase II transcription subunit 15a-like [Ipomoea triloba]